MKIALIADIHANITALKAIWPKIKKFDLILNAGDLSGYYPDVNSVVGFIRTHQDQITSILGNHDRWLCSEKIIGKVSPLVGKPLQYSLKEIFPENLAFLKTLPNHRVLELNGLKIGLFHGSPFNDDEYVYPDSNLEPFKKIPFDYLILGHTHWPMVKKVGKVTIINPGSVGQPRDGDPRASFVILDTTSGKIEFKRVRYNPQAVTRKIAKLGFDPRLAEILKGK